MKQHQEPNVPEDSGSSDEGDGGQLAPDEVVRAVFDGKTVKYSAAGFQILPDSDDEGDQGFAMDPGEGSAWAFLDPELDASIWVRATEQELVVEMSQGFIARYDMLVDIMVSLLRLLPHTERMERASMTVVRAWPKKGASPRLLASWVLRYLMEEGVAISPVDPPPAC